MYLIFFFLNTLLKSMECCCINPSDTFFLHTPFSAVTSASVFGYISSGFIETEMFCFSVVLGVFLQKTEVLPEWSCFNSYFSESCHWFFTRFRSVLWLNHSKTWICLNLWLSHGKCQLQFVCPWHDTITSMFHCGSGVFRVLLVLYLWATHFFSYSIHWHK